MTPPHHPGLHAAVVAHADDDTPRLAYADWLDDHGDPDRAAFIRLQCALWDKSPADPDWVDLNVRLDETRYALDLRRDDLAPRLPPAFTPNDGPYDDAPTELYGLRGFDRGFPFWFGETAYAPPPEGDAADRVGAAIGEAVAATTVRGLCFRDHRWAMAALPTALRSPAAGAIRAVRATTSTRGHRHDLLSHVTGSPAAAGLSWLALDVLGAPEDVDALEAAPMNHLTRFSCRWINAHASNTGRLTGADWFGRLRRVAVGLGPVYSDETGVIAGLANLPDLHTLGLMDLSAGGVSALAARGFPKLVRLDLYQTELTPDGAAALARADLPALRELVIGGPSLRGGDFAGLLRSPYFGQLRGLTLGAKRLGSRAFEQLVSGPAAASLKALAITNGSPGPGGLKALVRPGAFPNLLSLRLHPEPEGITPADVAGFFARAEFPRLRRLDVRLPLDPAAVRALAANPAFGTLTFLRLNSDPRVVHNLPEVDAIVRSPHLQGLRVLRLDRAETGDLVAALADPGVLPNLRSTGRGLSPGQLDTLGPSREHLATPTP